MNARVLHFTKRASLLLMLASAVVACSDDDDGNEPNNNNNSTDIPVPETFSFTRDGQSTVSYGGQIDRINQLNELKSYLKEGDAGNAIEEQVMLDMLANTGGNGNGNFSFTSDRDLESKTFSADVDFFKGLMADAAAASGTTDPASEGTAGLLTRSSGSTILVDANGHEYTQFIEKGLMGATLMYQILGVYLTDDRVGNDIDNENLEDGSNYTPMEHHWDEGFGYYGVPVDFTSNWPDARSGEALFWGNYSNGRDGLIGSNDVLMDAFIAGRTAIVNKNYDEKDAQRAILFQEFQRVSAATAIHYVNDVLATTNDGDRMHWLSEAWAFINALRYCDPTYRVLEPSEIDGLLENDLGENYWQVTTSGLNNIKTTLSNRFNLDDVKDNL